jgi:hypothetical protein
MFSARVGEGGGRAYVGHLFPHSHPREFDRHSFTEVGIF